MPSSISASHRRGALTNNAILAYLRKKGSRRNIEGMARYGIVSAKAFGVGTEVIRSLARSIGRDHNRALRLWTTGWYEARILAALIADPMRLSVRDMDRWCNDLDNWAITDGLCIHCFRFSPYAHACAVRWTGRRKEFVKRAGFTMIATLAVHDNSASDATFKRYLGLVHRQATDDRNGVKKAVNWALRQIGKRNLTLHAHARNFAERLAVHPSPAARWVGHDALRELQSPEVIRRLQTRERLVNRRQKR